MWPNSEHNGPQQNAFAEACEHVKDIRDGIVSLAKIGVTLDEFYAAYRKTSDAEQSEIIVASTTEAKTFRANGYRYNRIYIGDADATAGAKVKIMADGISWTVTLTAGENVVNMPDGATYEATSATNFNALLVRSNHA